jgi:inhibitor of the pro-sigma K processing machinery
MKHVFEKIVYFIFTIFIFIVLWKAMGKLWDAFVPWNYKTDLLGILIVTPLLIGISFILSNLCFKVIRSSK